MSKEQTASEVLRSTASDSAKVTALYYLFVTPDKEEVAIERNLSPKQVEEHLRLCAISPADPKEPVNVITLYSLSAQYAMGFRHRFGAWVNQPNIRAVLRKAIQVHGVQRTEKLLEAWLASVRNVEEALIGRFYVLHVAPKLKSAAKSSQKAAKTTDSLAL